MAFNTYIDDRAMIPVLLEHDWMIWKDTWTNCSYETYMALKKLMTHTGNATEYFLRGEMSQYTGIVRTCNCSRRTDHK